MARISKSAAFEAAREEADSRIIGRFARRNVLLQNGVYVSDMSKVADEGDKAMNSLRRKFKGIKAA